MANNVNQNPFILDTAADDILATTIPLEPKAMLWSGASTAGHVAQLEDGSEAVKCVLSATGNGDTVVFYFPPGFVMKGLSVGTLQSGTIYLYF